MKNIAQVIDALSGENRPHNATLASKVLLMLTETKNSDFCQATELAVTDLLRGGDVSPNDVRKCVYALCVGLPGSAADVIARARDSDARWNDFVLGFLEALEYLPNGEGSLSARPIKAEVEKAFAEALIDRREREGPLLSEHHSRLVSSFTANYDGLHLLALVKGKIDLNRCQGDPRAEAPIQIIREVCRLVFADKSLEDQLGMLVLPPPKGKKKCKKNRHPR